MKRIEADLLLKASLESEKKERKRIAADLHDSVSSDLSAIRNYLTVLIKSEEDMERGNMFQELKDGVEVAIENTRLISYKLMPPLLEKLGFVIALEDYLKSISKMTGIPFMFINKENELKIEVFIGYELFRIIQEFTTNMLKYGSISECSIKLYTVDSVIMIEIIEDGNAFDFKNQLATAKGTGIMNISSRLKVIHASIIQQDALIGNHFVISLPTVT